MDCNSRQDATQRSSSSPPSEADLFALAVRGKPIPRIVNPEVEAKAKRKELERLAQFSSRHADELRTLRFAEAEARHERELLEWAAQISTEAAAKLRALQRKEAEMREGWRRAEKFVETLLEGTWDSGKHPRAPKGQPDGGQWIEKGGGAGEGGVARNGTPVAIASYSVQKHNGLPPLRNQSSRNHPLHDDTAPRFQSASALSTSYHSVGEPDILNPASKNSVSRTFWEAIRRGDWTAAENTIGDVANVIDKTKLQIIKTALKRIRGLNSWRNQASKWTRKRIVEELKTLEKTLSRHLAKRDGVDTPETARIRYQLMFLKGLLK